MMTEPTGKDDDKTSADGPDVPLAVAGTGVEISEAGKAKTAPLDSPTRRRIALRQDSVRTGLAIALVVILPLIETPHFCSAARRPPQRARVLAATAISSTQPSTLIRVESMMRS